MVRELLREKLLLVLLALYAALCVVVPGFLESSLFLVDYNALALIACFLMVSRALEVSGAVSFAARALLDKFRGSPKLLLLSLIMLCEMTALVMMNDGVVFVVTPLVTVLARLTGLDVAFLAALVALAANIGSSASPIGNPQNIIVWQHFHLAFHVFVAGMIPYTIAASLILALYAAIALRKAERAVLAPPPPVKVDAGLAALSLALLALDVALAHLELQVVALLVTVAAMAVHRRDLLKSVDVPLLACFALMFMDFRGLSRALATASLIPCLHGSLEVMLASAALCQIIINVPATLALIDHVDGLWRPLAVGVNLGALGLAWGSMANIIALRLSGAKAKEFMKHTVPVMLAILGAVLALALLGIYP